MRELKPLWMYVKYEATASSQKRSPAQRREDGGEEGSWGVVDYFLAGNSLPWMPDNSLELFSFFFFLNTFSTLAGSSLMFNKHTLEAILASLYTVDLISNQWRCGSLNRHVSGRRGSPTWGRGGLMKLC